MIETQDNLVVRIGTGHVVAEPGSIEAIAHQRVVGIGQRLVTHRRNNEDFVDRQALGQKAIETHVCKQAAGETKPTYPVPTTAIFMSEQDTDCETVRQGWCGTFLPCAS